MVTGGPETDETQAPAEPQKDGGSRESPVGLAEVWPGGREQAGETTPEGTTTAAGVSLQAELNAQVPVAFSTEPRDAPRQQAAQDTGDVGQSARRGSGPVLPLRSLRLGPGTALFSLRLETLPSTLSLHPSELGPVEMECHLHGNQRDDEQHHTPVGVSEEEEEAMGDAVGGDGKRH